MTRQQLIARLSRLIRVTSIHRLIVWILDRLQYWTFNHLKRGKLVKTGPRRSNKLALFAIFQPRGLSTFVVRELQYLISLGYDVAISIPHDLPPDQEKMLDSLCRFRIKRPNFGRDFGSFCDAILAIGFDAIAEYDRVLMVNDSIFFPIGATEQFTRELEEAVKRADVVGLCENSETARHIGSFFIEIATSVFCSPACRAYWTKYRRYNSRFHAIRKGECGLSKVLYRQAKNIRIIYSKERLTEQFLAAFSSDFQLPRIFHLLSDPFFGPLKRSLLSMEPDGEERSLVLIDELRKRLEASSIPHSVGLQLITMFDAPFLKRDVYYHEIFDLPQIRMALEGRVEPELVEAIILELRKKGSARNQTLWGELMIRLGLR
ncbi:hypothetical protein GCM10023144_40580 [Pigmentiphaga soli]|uniref:Rhamnan synthesis protein F n=1 Tax=Pigmentiphaga soli TaxID=1007095 RepID=A0ABP8HKN0_9BURK